MILISEEKGVRLGMGLGGGGGAERERKEIAKAKE